MRRSDVIVLARAETLYEIRASLVSDRVALYEGDMRVVETFKGEPVVEAFRLRFEPSATSIGRGAQHVFFLKRKGTAFEALKASFVFPREQGYGNNMRVAGTYDCSADLGIAVIEHLVGGQTSADLDVRLMSEYESRGWGKMYSAVFMAAAAPAVVLPVLHKVVSDDNPKRFDLQLYGTAAYALARHGSVEDWRSLLHHISSGRGHGRVPESIVFDLVATFGDEGVIPEVRAAVTEKPELAVSAAFALLRIGGSKAHAQIESWLADERLVRRETVISDGWEERKASFRKLFEQALTARY